MNVEITKVNNIVILFYNNEEHDFSFNTISYLIDYSLSNNFDVTFINKIDEVYYFDLLNEIFTEIKNDDFVKAYKSTLPNN